MTTADARSYLLHQYDVSPFSEKVRVGFGIKNCAWFACNQPSILPKPDLVALTGGYRRIPVLQIGADLYFDSGLILEEIERRQPTPSLFDGTGAGLGTGLAYWSDSFAPGGLFSLIVTLLFGNDWDVNPAFVADRAQMRGGPFDVEAMAAARPQAEDQLLAHLDLLETQLADGRAFLTGAHPGVADASFYHLIAFIRWGKGQTAALLSRFPRLLQWEQRVKAIGHGQRSSVSPQQAIAIAAGASPAALTYSSNPGPNDPALQSQVRVKYHDANSPELAGTLAGITARRLSIAVHSEAAGPLMLHMPRTVGAVRPAS